MRGLCLLPYRWQMHIGRTLGRGVGRLARKRRRIARINLSLCFPELSWQQRETLLNNHFAALGMGLFEVGLAWWAPEQKLRAMVHFEGLRHLERAIASGQGVLLLTGHFTTLELGARFITFKYPFHAVYQRHRNPLYEDKVLHNRQRRSGLPAIARDDVRGMIRALRRGGIVWYAPDQDYKKQGVFVPFFDVQALTVSATSRLAQMGRALVVPYFSERLSDGRYRITVLPALEGFPGEDEAQDARRINQLLEQWVRRRPEQYLWIHRRFKTRPPGEDRLY